MCCIQSTTTTIRDGRVDESICIDFAQMPFQSTVDRLPPLRLLPIIEPPPPLLINYPSSDDHQRNRRYRLTDAVDRQIANNRERRRMEMMTDAFLA